jgi:hypothetical protein
MGVVSSVLMNLCTHCSHGMSLQASSQLHTWYFGQLRPVYLTSQLTACAENRVVIKVRHCVQSVILLLCVPHHLAGVAFRASSMANSLCCVGTLSSSPARRPLMDSDHQMWVSRLLLCRSNELLWLIWHIFW